jgi:hypothetical protein
MPACRKPASRSPGKSCRPVITVTDVRAEHVNLLLLPWPLQSLVCEDLAQTDQLADVI